MVRVDVRRAYGGAKSMSAFFSNKWFILGVRIALGAVFIYSGAIKIAAPQDFADSIATFRMVPAYLIHIIALGLPVFEVLLGGMLIVGWMVRPAALAVLVLTGIFAVALVQALFRGLEVDCGCFGSGEASAGNIWVSLGRDVVLMAGAGWLYYFKAGRARKGENG